MNAFKALEEKEKTREPGGSCHKKEPIFIEIKEGLNTSCYSWDDKKDLTSRELIALALIATRLQRLQKKVIITGSLAETLQKYTSKNLKIRKLAQDIALTVAKEQVSYFKEESVRERVGFLIEGNKRESQPDPYSPLAGYKKVLQEIGQMIEVWAKNLDIKEDTPAKDLKKTVVESWREDFIEQFYRTLLEKEKNQHGQPASSKEALGQEDSLDKRPASPFAFLDIVKSWF